MAYIIDLFYKSKNLNELDNEKTNSRNLFFLMYQSKDQ